MLKEHRRSWSLALSLMAFLASPTWAQDTTIVRPKKEVKTLSFKATLGARPGTGHFPAGLTDFSDNDRSFVLVKEPGAGLKKGDVIMSINGKAVTSCAQVETMIKSLDAASKLTVRVLSVGVETERTLYLRSEVEGYLGLSVSEKLKAIVLTKVVERSPAAHAGLKVGDILLSCEGVPYSDYRKFFAVIKKAGMYARLELKLLRDGEVITKVARLGSTEFGLGGFLGVNYSTTGLPSINSVVKGTAAERIGLKSGDVLVEINGQALSSSTDLKTYIQSHAPGDTITLKVKRTVLVKGPEPESFPKQP